MNIHVLKTVPIEFKQVVDAYRKVKKGGKATGIDKETWEEFDKAPEKNLYVIWNRLASGSYHPQAVREVEIQNTERKTRKLGIPTLRDRIAQQVVKDYMEKRIDSKFHENSYGYRPLKSAHQAVEQVRQNCQQQDWVIDLDISKFFEEIDHELMLKAVAHVMEEKWVMMYVERWLQMPIQTKDGKLHNKQGKGTPQGGVISPLLANLYLHFTLDLWLNKHYPEIKFVRYADDIILHCQSKAQAEVVLQAIKERLAETKLRVNEEKTRITYCKDYHRKEKQEVVKFEFLGFSYQPRSRQSKFNNTTFLAFAPEISQSNQKKIREAIKALPIWKNTTIQVGEIAKSINEKSRGWIGYYGKYSKKSLRNVLLHIDKRLVRWMRKKYKVGVRKAVSNLTMLRQTNPRMFYHWQAGYK